MENDVKNTEQAQAEKESHPDFNPREEAEKRRAEQVLALAKPHKDKSIVKPEERTSEQPTDMKAEEAKEAKSSEEQKTESSEEINALKKRYQDNQAYAREVQRRLALAKSKIHELAENNDMDEKVAQALLGAIESSSLKQPDDLKTKADEAKGEEPKGLFSPLYKVLTPDLWHQYLEVAEDDKADRKAIAFDRLVIESSEEEQRALFDRVIEQGKSPMQLLKSMLKIGEEFLNEGFDAYMNSGGLKKYNAHWQEKTEKLQKEIDKLTKKVREYEGNFDKPEKMTLGKSQFGSDAPDRPFNAREEAENMRMSKMRPLLAS